MCASTVTERQNHAEYLEMLWSITVSVTEDEMQRLTWTIKYATFPGHKVDVLNISKNSESTEIMWDTLR